MAAGSLLLTVLAADRLSHGVRGAMCAYGVFRAVDLGFPALGTSVVVALVGGVVTQLFALDGRLRGSALVRPLAWIAIAVAPLALLDLVVTAGFLLRLDLTVVASCCSVGLDTVAGADGGFVGGPRELATGLALLLVSAAALYAWRTSRRSRAADALGPVVASGLLSALALPFACAAAVLEVAPYVFELPGHLCPFCLLRSDVYGIGYPLFGAIFLAVTWSLGTAAGALLLRRTQEDAELRTFAIFARPRLRNEAIAWSFALALGALPVVRYTLVAGAPLFH
jgi:hypothetical protein